MTIMPKKYLVTRNVIGVASDNREDCIVQLYYHGGKMVVLGRRMIWILEENIPTVRLTLQVDGFEVYGVGLSVDSVTGVLFVMLETAAFEHFVVKYDLNENNIA